MCRRVTPARLPCLSAAASKAPAACVVRGSTKSCDAIAGENVKVSQPLLASSGSWLASLGVVDGGGCGWWFAGWLGFPCRTWLEVAQGSGAQGPRSGSGTDRMLATKTRVLALSPPMTSAM